MKYCLVSLGCQMNLSDAERVSSVLEAMGYEHTESEEEANILGLVACSVRQRAIDRAYAKIQKWNSWKNSIVRPAEISELSMSPTLWFHS